jgi:hypothetical protein
MKPLKYIKLFEDRLESLRKLVELGLVDQDMQKVIDYMSGPMTGHLVLSGSSIKSLPDGLVVGSDLWLEHSSIESLPDGLRVGGYLDLSNTPIKSLPKGLEVGGNLWVYGIQLTELPDDLLVRGKIFNTER